MLDEIFYNGERKHIFFAGAVVGHDAMAEVIMLPEEDKYLTKDTVAYAFYERIFTKPKIAKSGFVYN